MKKFIGKAFMLLCMIMFFIGSDSQVVFAGSCQNASCGCGDRGISSCFGSATCWYNDSEGCTGHSWYLYEKTSVTCTSRGRVIYKCSICPGERIFSIHALGHDWGSWKSIDSSRHMRICRRCGLIQYEEHTMSDWKSHGDGNYSRRCPTCGYTQSKGLFVSVFTTNWTATDVEISISGYDEGDGNAKITLYRVNGINGLTEQVEDFNHDGAYGWTSDSYTQKNEGIYSFYAVATDTAGHSIRVDTERVYLDHSNSEIIGIDSIETDWTNIAPVISVKSTDYLYDSNIEGSGVKSLAIYDDAGEKVTTGVSSTAYTLEEKYEGEHTWKIEAIDNVDHVTEEYVTTRYDITPPGIDGTEITYVMKDGKVISGYCQDNIINQHIDDEIVRSVNGANKSSGIKNIILYKVAGTEESVIYSNTTYHKFENSDTHSYFDVFYDINQTDDAVDYYLLITEDFAGNRTRKKLTSQRMLLTLFHTSIDRGAY